MLPFGIHKGKQYDEVSPSYLLYILGYKDKDGRRCLLPKYDKSGFAFRYPELHETIINNINKCLRCDNDIDKKTENIHLKILCQICYDKHESNAVYRKTIKEKEFDKNILTDEHKILNKLIEKYKLVLLNKFIGKENMWEQEKPCGICNKSCYGCEKYNKATKLYYNLCSECFTEKGILNNNNFDMNLYSDYFNELQNSISNIQINNIESALVTKQLTELCIEIANKNNLTYILEKPSICGININKKVFYDIELSNGETKFIIEIDRTHNENTVSKLDDALYHKAIWIRWGNIDINDISTNKYDIITMPLLNKNKKWSNIKVMSNTVSKTKNKKVKTLFDYGFLTNDV
jgi:hypothetical protein